jgi:hypothetical protein
VQTPLFRNVPTAIPQANGRLKVRQLTMTMSMTLTTWVLQTRTLAEEQKMTGTRTTVSLRTTTGAKILNVPKIHGDTNHVDNAGWNDETKLGGYIFKTAQPVRDYIVEQIFLTAEKF